MAIKQTFYKPQHRINQFIRVPEVRVLREDGSQVGVISTAEALQLARDAGLDLVEIAPQAKPPVCKIIEYNKYKYLESKKEQQAKKNAKEVDTKELRFRPFMSDGDVQTRLKRIKEFLEDGDRVKIVIQFRGREVTRPEFGKNLVRKISEYVAQEGVGKLDREPRMEGKQMTAGYAPIAK